MKPEERYEHYYNEGYNAGSVKGYDQAIKKACECLKSHASQYASLFFLPESDYPQPDVEVESLVNAFTQAMKGGEK